MDEEDPYIETFHSKFSQRYPVDEVFINEKKTDDEGVRGEFFGVLLSASEDERKEFALYLLPDDPNVRHPATLPFDIGQKLGRYGREAPLQSIVNFLTIYIRNPNKISIFSSDKGTFDTIKETIRAKMQPRIAAALVPENSNRWGFKKAGRRRKTKKSKRRARKTRRRHK